MCIRDRVSGRRRKAGRQESEGKLLLLEAQKQQKVLVLESEERQKMNVSKKQRIGSVERRTLSTDAKAETDARAYYCKVASLSLIHI